MLAAPSSPIAPAFQQLLPVDVPASVRLLAAEPSASTPRSRCSTPREFSFGLLTAFCSPELVDRVLAECGRQERRCRLLPARLVVYALLLMCLSADLGYAKLMHHLAGLPGLSGAWTAPHKTAFLRARQRLGWEVMERLFRALARPLGEPARDQACFWRGRRVLALDGTTLELAVNPELEQAFGGQLANHRGTLQRVGPPRARLLTLAECGTRALLDAELGHYEQGENTLARCMVRSLGPGMLLLADRGFPSKLLWKTFTEAGVDLLWRAKQGVGQRRLRELADGSYLVRFGKGDPLTVRVIEYRLHGSGQRAMGGRDPDSRAKDSTVRRARPPLSDRDRRTPGALGPLPAPHHQPPTRLPRGAHPPRTRSRPDLVQPRPRYPQTQPPPSPPGGTPGAGKRARKGGPRVERATGPAQPPAAFLPPRRLQEDQSLRQPRQPPLTRPHLQATTPNCPP